MKYLTVLSVVSLSALAILSIDVQAQAQSSNDYNIDPAQIARGAQSWAKECGRCHNLRSPSELTDEEWVVSTTHMRVRANIPGDVIRDIRAFLKNSNKGN